MDKKPADPLHCGSGKAGEFDDDLCISPTDTACDSSMR
jgi:hypothetical protein